MELKDFFRENPRVALGFSGGTDSAYLLYEAVEHGAQVRPYFVKTAFQPAFELADARRLCKQLGVELAVPEADVLSQEAVRSNPKDRCYHCKRALFGVLQEQAARDGYTVLMDGTNASDDAGDRPGMRAIRELSVRSPLRECGITKAEVRRRSKEAGLFTWDKPAYACLATRIPTGEEITSGLLQKVEQAEDCLFSLGFTDFRVRVFHAAARLQLPEDQMTEALARRKEIQTELKPYFSEVFLDLQSR